VTTIVSVVAGLLSLVFLFFAATTSGWVSNAFSDAFGWSVGVFGVTFLTRVVIYVKEKM